MRMYKQQDMALAMIQVYKKTPAEMNKAFTDYVRLFTNDEVLERRMADLLRELFLNQ